MEVAPASEAVAAPSFNEAEARKPRMEHLYLHLWRQHQCFNEAEARKPRMRRFFRHGDRACECASMRPRLVSLGCHEEAGPLSGFNEAEARKPRMHVFNGGYAYRAAGFNEAEARKPRMPCHDLPETQRNIAASMRPRLVSLGCLSSVGVAVAGKTPLQ